MFELLLIKRNDISNRVTLKFTKYKTFKSAYEYYRKDKKLYVEVI